MVTSGRALARYETACQALAEARTIDEVKDIHDEAVAMAAYARQINFKAQAAHRSPRQPYSRLPGFTSGTKGHTAFVPGNVLLRPSNLTESESRG